MPDSKITALTSTGTGTDPAVDPLVIVDVSDTTMAATGTTKKVTLNQLLACSPTATLASATITGDLTVDTSTLKVDSALNRVGIGTASPITTFQVQDANLTGAGQIREQVIRAAADNTNNSLNSLVGFTFSTGSAAYTAGSLVRSAGVYGINLDNSAFGRTMGLSFYTCAQDAAATEKYRIDNSGIATWSNVGGVAGTAMTLNATGLGVGNSPVAALDVYKVANDTINRTNATFCFGQIAGLGAALLGQQSASAPYQFNLQAANAANSVQFPLVLQPSGGNVGIGVASPSNRLETQEAGTGSGLGGIVSSTATVGGNAGYVFRTGGTNRWSLSLTGSAGAESIRFYDVNNSATRLLIDTSGNVGIGVTPSALWNAAFKALQIGSSNYFSIAAQNSAASRGSLLWNAIGSGDEAFVYRSTGDAANRFMVGSGFFAWYTAPSGTAGNAITFTQAMTLDASGNWIIGGTSQISSCRASITNTGGDQLAINATNTTTGQSAIKFCNAGTAQAFIWWDKSDSRLYVQNSSGGVYLASTATSWTANSDERLKDIIEPISNAVAKVGSLRSVIGKFKTDSEGTRRSFLIAQDVQSVLPEAVDASNPERLGVAYSDVIPLLVAAIKELAAEVNALKNA